MMISFLGEKTFKAGLKTLLVKHHHSNIDHDDLWKILTQQAHADDILPKNFLVEDIMKSWTEYPGFPVITARADYSKNLMHLSQVS